MNQILNDDSHAQILVKRIPARDMASAKVLGWPDLFKGKKAALWLDPGGVIDKEVGEGGKYQIVKPLEESRFYSNGDGSH